MLKNCLNMTKKFVFSEILDVFKSVCHAHMLPIALVWIPFTSAHKEMANYGLDEETWLCIQKTACCVNDQNMQGFLHACSENHLRKGQGLAGKAIESNTPVFSSDIKTLTINQYPLVHHTRRFGLHAAVAIRLRSNYTGNEDYILEFFLPTNCKGNTEQQLLLKNLSVTLQKMCKSLRTVSGTELTESMYPNDGTISRSETTSQLASSSSETANIGGHSSPSLSIQIQAGDDCQGEAATSDKMKSYIPRHQKRLRNIIEKNVNLSVLQKYYCGTLNAAAESIGVCPTTLKRICRLNGISRWPSRKINKVHSAQKIQSVLDTVPEVMGKFKFDYNSRKLIKEVISQEKEMMSNLESSGYCKVVSSSKLADNNQLVAKMREGLKQLTGTSFQSKNISMEQDDEMFSQADCRDDYSSVKGVPNLNEEYIATENLKSHSTSKSTTTKLEVEEMKTGTDASDAKVTTGSWLFGISRPCSSTTNSSIGSASREQTIKNKKEVNMVPADPGLVLRVKASYKDDKMRFKFFPSKGIDHLNEEIAKRFELSVGTFQLKYEDDEEEWILLTNEDDLKECTEMLESMNLQILRLLIRDMPSGFGSSNGSNSMHTGS